MSTQNCMTDNHKRLCNFVFHGDSMNKIIITSKILNNADFCIDTMYNRWLTFECVLNTLCSTVVNVLKLLTFIKVFQTLHLENPP